MLLVGHATPSAALLIRGGDGNTSAPGDDPGWDNVGLLDGGSAVYLGNGWVLTPAHVWDAGPTTANFDGTDYGLDLGSWHQLHEPGDPATPADLGLLRLSGAPPSGLCGVVISQSPLPNNAEVLGIGYGTNYEPIETWWNWEWQKETGTPHYRGFQLTSGRTKRWGENNLDGNGQVLLESGAYTTHALQMTFNHLGGAGDNEMQAVPGDAGGGLFYNNAGQWELAGVFLARTTYFGDPGVTEDDQPLDTAVYGNESLAADLKPYAPQIFACASGALSKVAGYQVAEAQTPTLERLARWDGTSWVPVRAGELSSANIHVLVHGWAPGLRAFADAGGKIWQAEVGGYTNPFESDLTQAAQALSLAAPGQLIVAFNWLDKSATPTSPPDRVSSLQELSEALQAWWEATISRVEAGEMGPALADALHQAFGDDGTFSGKLHLLGISHGALVATEAAAELYKHGEEDSIVVDHLTLGDSPETNLRTPKGLIPIGGAANGLQWIFGSPNQLNVGRTEGTTFVDNYYSLLGKAYTDKLFGLFGDSHIVNVQLYPDESWDMLAKHRYPLDWYRDATVFSRTLALGWSPLLGDAYKTLASDYEQDWQAGEFFLKEAGGGEAYPIELRSDMHLATIETQGNVAEIAGGVRLTEGSSAYWHSSFTKEAEDVGIEFTYQFLNTGDGDQLGLWLDGELRFIMTGQLIDTDPRTSVMDISDLTPGYHILSVALHSYGEPNSIVEVRDFTLISVPEPSSLALLAAGALIVLAHLLRKRRRAYARLAE
jgi:hypothetical protein